ncbi:chorismate mutase [Nocardia sp. GCM10030253]|uniref:chorismate mutase n=1 Tax=Nocardia sp. GCM10030253 TaxID=3273404 RepID=UPI003633AA7F
MPRGLRLCPIRSHSRRSAVRAPARVEQVVALARERATAAGLAPDVAESVWRAMIGAFIELELVEQAAIRDRVGA